MQKLLETLERLGAGELSALIGRETISILDLMGGKQVAPYRLAELVVQQFGVEELLLEKTKRHLILETLLEEDASRLCRNLDLAFNQDPWNTLLKCKFSANSPRTRVLFAFFGCEEPSAEKEQAVSANPVEITPEYSLFDHQIDACRQANQILENPEFPRVLLHMPTGAGKTRTAMNIIAHFIRQRLSKEDMVVWLAHSEELCEQAADEFQKAWQYLGIRKLPLHRCFGANKPDLASIESGVVIGGLQMMFSKSQLVQSEFLAMSRRVKLVVMDEAHQAIAPTYKHLLEMLAADNSTAILGLSATPGRSTFDAMQDLELASFFGRNKVTLSVEGYDSPVNFLQEEGYLATVNYERINHVLSPDFKLSDNEQLALQQGLDVTPSILKKLASDERRNLLVLNRILEECQNKGKKIIVFACSVEHAHLIANILSAKGINAAAITSNTRPNSRREIIANYRDTDEVQVLTNYGVLTTGFDAPRTNTAIIARPTDSVVLFSQMVGRASRGTRAGGNGQCTVITVVDDLPGFRSVAEAFEYWDDIWE